MPDAILAPDGVDTQTFHPAVSAHSPEALVPAGRPIVVYLGLLNEYQGVPELLFAIPKVLRQVPDAHFLIMGYPNEELYRQRALALGVGDHVTFTGRVDYRQAPQYLALGSVAVSPKKDSTESNGKLYNYMAMSLPTVVFDTPVNREILGESGVYVPVGDVDGLAAAIARLLTDRRLATDLGTRLRRRVVDQFSWDYTARQLLSAYTLAHNRRRGQG